jgi:hypothetical protein
MALIPYSHLLLLQAVVEVVRILARLLQAVLAVVVVVEQTRLLGAQVLLVKVMLAVTVFTKTSITPLAVVAVQGLSVRRPLLALLVTAVMDFQVVFLAHP